MYFSVIINIITFLHHDKCLVLVILNLYMQMRTSVAFRNELLHCALVEIGMLGAVLPFQGIFLIIIILKHIPLFTNNKSFYLMWRYLCVFLSAASVT